jgi:hypothetical protein
MIVVNSHRVNQGGVSTLKEIERKEITDFSFIREEDPGLLWLWRYKKN